MVYFFSSNISLVGQDSKGPVVLETSKHSTQEDPSGSPDPKNNKPNKSFEQEDNNTIKSPIYPHTPVKVYIDVLVSKSDIYKDFKDVSIIYM